MQNDENTKLNKKRQSTTAAVRSRTSSTVNDCKNKTSPSTKANCVKQTVSEAVRRRTYVLSLLTLVLSVLVLALSFTYSQLSANKTATGSITFTLESPAVTYETPLNFKYESGTMTYGLTTDGGTALSSVPYNITIDSDNILSSYYALVGFQFIDTSTNAEITSGITFGASPSFGSVTMSALTYDATYKSFVSKTPTAVAKGSTLNLMSYFGIMNLSSLLDATIRMNILLVLDKSPNFQSVNRTQNTFNANVLCSAAPTYNIDGEIAIHIKGNSTTTTVTTACNLTVSPSTYIKLIAYKLPYRSVTNTSFSKTIDNVEYSCDVIESNDTDYDFTITSKTKVSNVNLSSIVANCANGIGKSSDVSGIGRTLTASLYYSHNNVDFVCLKESIPYKYTQQCCVAGDTKVSIGFNGETKLAKAIVVGDKVLTMNTQTGEYSLQAVTKVIAVKRYELATVTLKDGSVLKLTPDHPILTKNGWAICGNSTTYDVSPDTLRDVPLSVGDLVKTQNGYVEVESIEILTTTKGIDVYSFAIENNHNFFAENILIHNVTSCCS